MRVIDLKRWTNFYQSVCTAVLKKEAADGGEREKLKELFYDYYKIDCFYDLKPMELAQVMLLAAAALNGSVALDVQTICHHASENQLTLQTSVAIMSSFLEEKDILWECFFDRNSILNQYFIEIWDHNKKEFSGAARSLNSVICLKDYVIGAMQGEKIPIEGTMPALEYRQDNTQLTVSGRKEEADWLKEIFAKVLLPGQEGMIQLRGDTGEGKKHLTSYVAGYFYKGLLILQGKLLINMRMEELRASLELAKKAVFFDGAVVYLDLNGITLKPHGGSGELTDGEFKLSMLLTLLQKELKQFIIGGSLPVKEWIHGTKPLYIKEWKHVTAMEQKELWSYFAKEYQVEFDEELLLDELVSVYDLTPQKIGAVVQMCVPFAVRSQEKNIIKKRLLSDSIRKLVVANFDELVTKLESPFTWEDLKVAKGVKEKLMQAINRIRYRNIVNDTYGFGKKLPYGQGVVIALYGPSGTGKTMAANVIANELNLDIYRIDLSQVSSKYVGESEKNLARIFDTAKNSNAILFFDEADSLFAKRTGVGSSTDKYANAETGFLLQKMEEYRGISILATNLIQSFDAAFKRRITYMIAMERPTQEERLELWKSIFPPETPLFEDVRFEVFAKLADELTGSSIKSAALAATYTAAAKNRPVMQKDIAEAVNEEYMKLGHTSILHELFMG